MKTKQIGRPGTASKYKIPDGFRLFEVFREGPLAFGSIRYFVDDRPDFGALLVTNGNQSAGDIKLLLNPWTWTEATSAWSSGTEYQIEISLPNAGFRYTVEENNTIDDVLESTNCDESNHERTTITSPQIITEFNGLNGARPQIGMRLNYLNKPTSVNLCYQEIKEIKPIKILIKDSILDSINFNYSMLSMVEKKEL